jgi:hypothetical protein
MKKLLFALVVPMFVSFAASSTPAEATPLAAAAALAQAAPDGLVQQAHWRRYRHCHRGGYGRRWCHGGYRHRPRRCVRVPVRICRYGRGCSVRYELRCRGRGWR